MNLDALSGLLSGYFHQDWDTEWSDWTTAISSFGRNECIARIVDVVGELRILRAANMSETDLEQWLMNNGCFYHPPGTGIPASAWIQELEDSLATTGAERASASDTPSTDDPC